MADIIDGKFHATHLQEKVSEQVEWLKINHGIIPSLAVVIVGEDPASQIYVRNKGKAAVAVNMASKTITMPTEISKEKLLKTIEKLNLDESIHGILVQLPLPDPLDELEIINAIAPEKDVDGLHSVNAGRLSAGLPSLVPCTPHGCLKLLETVYPPNGMTGLKAIIIGRSILVGKPIAQLLLAKDCTVTMAHSKTRDLPSLCRKADVLVAAVGKPEMIKGDWVKPGSVVIDVGINRIETVGGKTRLVGDVDYQEVFPLVKAITPVPGGVGPMTIASLLANTVTACCRQMNIEELTFSQP